VIEGERKRMVLDDQQFIRNTARRRESSTWREDECHKTFVLRSRNNTHLEHALIVPAACPINSTRKYPFSPRTFLFEVRRTLGHSESLTRTDLNNVPICYISHFSFGSKSPMVERITYLSIPFRIFVDRTY